MIILWNSADMTVRLVVVNDGQKVEYEWDAGRNLARDMLAYLRDRLAEHDAGFTDITGIGVYRGPGSFTGLRIGVAVLNTLARDRQLPIVGAVGDNWQQVCLERLQRGESDAVVVPEYGRPARVTQPKK